MLRSLLDTFLYAQQQLSHAKIEKDTAQQEVNKNTSQIALKTILKKECSQLHPSSNQVPMDCPCSYHVGVWPSEDRLLTEEQCRFIPPIISYF